MFLALALGFIFSGIVLFFLSREEKPNKSEQEVITLEELSSLWMHWNIEDKNQRATAMGLSSGESQDLSLGQPAQKEKTTKGWQNEAIKEFWKKQVLPWRRILESQSALFPIMKILGLLDKHGSCPSIVMAQSDQESKDLKDHWHALSKVSLLDHTLRVTNHVIEIYNSHYKDQILRGAYILAGLSHDLGKIPSLREGRVYSLGDHPLISAGILTELAKGVPYLEQVIGAVKTHHFPKPQDELAEYLQHADKKAREEELILFARETGDEEGETVLKEQVEQEESTGIKIIPFPVSVKQTNYFTQVPEWLRTNLSDILKHVLPHINQSVGFNKYNNRWQAFSMPNGICYIDPTFLLRKTKEVMDEKRITDINFMDNSLREKAKILIADALRERGWLGGGVKEGYYGAYWNCYSPEGQEVIQGYWTPVIIDAFGILPHELEIRKPETLREIKRVELCTEVRQ